jgi:hypothetical protein
VPITESGAVGAVAENGASPGDDPVMFFLFQEADIGW